MCFMELLLAFHASELHMVLALALQTHKRQVIKLMCVAEGNLQLFYFLCEILLHLFVFLYLFIFLIKIFLFIFMNFWWIWFILILPTVLRIKECLCSPIFDSD